MISFFVIITDMKEAINRHLNLKYIIPFIFYELTVFISSLALMLIFKDKNIYSYAELISTFMMLIFIYFFFRKDLNIKLDKELFKLIIKYAIIIFSLNIICSYIESILSILFNTSLDTTNQGLLIEMFYNDFFILSITAIFAGLIEEMLYRYSIFKLFKDRKLAFVMSWLIFAFGHFTGFNTASYISMISYLTLSFVLTYIYYKYDDIRLNCGVHVLNNVMGVLEIFVFMCL